MSEVSNTFEMTLREIRGGGALTELSTKLAELVAAVRATGKAGKLRLEIAVTPASRGEAVCLMLDDDISLKLPRLEKASSIFFATDQNLLQRQDPRQKEFELREVNPAPQEIREVPVMVDQAARPAAMGG